MPAASRPAHASAARRLPPHDVSAPSFRVTSWRPRGSGIGSSNLRNQDIRNITAERVERPVDPVTADSRSRSRCSGSSHWNGRRYRDRSIPRTRQLPAMNVLYGSRWAAASLQIEPTGADDREARGKGRRSVEPGRLFCADPPASGSESRLLLPRPRNHAAERDRAT
jgi:hypothetical protein